MSDWEEIGPSTFRRGSLTAIVTQDVDELENKWWHLSISHPTRYPKWDEIKEARYALLPDDITVGMLLPPKDGYVNLHPNCFHLHEVAANRIVSVASELAATRLDEARYWYSNVDMDRSRADKRIKELEEQ